MQISKAISIAAAALLLFVQAVTAADSAGALGLRGSRDLHEDDDDEDHVCSPKCNSFREDCDVLSSGETGCVCKPGFSRGPEFRAICEDEDECKLDYPCPLNDKISFCVDMDPPMRYKCGCLPGFDAVLPLSTAGFTEPVPLDFRPITCVDRNECAVDAPCDLTTSTCVNSLGSFFCECLEGFQPDGKNICVKIETDAAEAAIDPDTCLNRAGKDRCDPDTQVCARSTNNPEVSVCLCVDGFEQTREDAGCKEVNECTRGRHNCDENARCDNIPGTFLCNCNSGFSGTGTVGNCAGGGFVPPPPTPPAATVPQEGESVVPVTTAPPPGGSTGGTGPGPKVPVVPLLYISEWVDGSVAAIEFCNPSKSEDVDLTGYTLEVFTGEDTAQSPDSVYTFTTGIVPPGAAYIVVNQAQQTSNQAQQTGNRALRVTPVASTLPQIDAAGPIGSGSDLIVLKKNGVVVDSLGQQGSTADWGNDKTLRRKADNVAPDTTTTDSFSAIAYDQYGADNYFGFGSCERPSVLHSVVINEILPNPAASGGGIDTDGDTVVEATDEFIELYNNEDIAVDISGLQFWDANQNNFYAVPAGTTIGARGYLVVVKSVDGGNLPNVAAGSLAVTAPNMVLNDPQDNIVIYDPRTDEYIQIKYGAGETDDNVLAGGTEYVGFSASASRIGSVVDYGSSAGGVSMILSPDGCIDNIVKHNTIGLGSTSATPGTANIDGTSALNSFVINEVLANPTTTSEFIEIFNTGTKTLDLSGIQLWDATSGVYFTYPAGASLGAGSFDVQTFTATSAVLTDDAAGESIVFYDPKTNQYIQAKYGTAAAADVAATFTNFPAGAARIGGVLDLGIHAAGTSNALSPDGNIENPVQHNSLGDGTIASTPGNTNLGTNSVLNSIVFNEVLVDPATTGGGFNTNQEGAATSTDEFIEIYNTGTSALDVSNLQFWDATGGKYFTVPSGTSLAAGGFLIVVSVLSDPAVLAVNAGSHAFQADELMTLGNDAAGESLVIFDPSTNTYIQAKYGTGAAADVPATFTGFTAGATLDGTVQDLGTVIGDGISTALIPDGDVANPVLQNSVRNEAASPGKTNEAPPAISPIYISEYTAGTGSNNALELCNPTAGALDLNTFTIEIFRDGSSATTGDNYSLLTLSGSIAAEKTFVISSDSAAASLANFADLQNGEVSWTGNDAIVVKRNGVVVDSLGQIGNGNDYGAGKTLRRKSGTIVSDTVATDAFTTGAYDELAEDTFDGFGLCEGVQTPVYISEYVEGTGNNKALELCNPSSAAIDLAGYSIEVFRNGNSATSGTTLYSKVDLTGSIAAGAAFVVVSDTADAALKAFQTVESAAANWNGNDAIVVKKDGIVIDSFGQVGNNADYAEAHTYRRKSGSILGDKDPDDVFTVSADYDEFPVDDFLGVGDCTAVRAAPPPPSPPRPTEIFISEYSEGSGNNKAIELCNPTGTVFSLEGYTIVLYRNGGATFEVVVDLSGSSIPVDDAFVAVHQSAVAALKTKGDVEANLNWNGNDPVVLMHNGAVVDSIGQVGPNIEFAESVTLRRKQGSFAGDTDVNDAFVAATEYEELDADTFDNFGSCDSTGN